MNRNIIEQELAAAQQEFSALRDEEQSWVERGEWFRWAGRMQHLAWLLCDLECQLGR